MALDVTDRASVVHCFDEIEAQGGCPDLIVNNAGTANSATALQLSEAEWDSVVDTNLKGAWLVCQESGKRLVAAQRGGAIVNITSLLAERVAGGTAPYAASKAGLRQLTELLAAPYVVDTVTVPAENPFGSWIRVGGIDFFKDGRIAFSTWSGDVWVGKFADDKLSKISWHRYATGIFHGLGLKIVNEQIYVLGRDQITLLHDFNKDGEADFYENFNNDVLITKLG